MKKILSAFMLFIFMAIPKIQAQESDFNIWGSGEVFQLSPVLDGALLGTSIVMNGAWLLLDKGLKVKGGDGIPAAKQNKSSVNAFDAAWMEPYSHGLDRAADILCLASVLTPLSLLATEKSEWLTIGVMYAESLLWANGVKELLKLAVDRDRTYMYFDQRPSDPDDWNKSWPSGHTTLSFTSAAFLSYTFCTYFPESPWRFAVIGGSYALSATTALLRIGGGSHFATDVLSGMAIGTVCGLLVPWLHSIGPKKKDSGGVSASVSPMGANLRISF